MLEKLVGPEIRELIEAKDFATLGDCLNRWLPADLAGLIADLPRDEQAQVLKALTPPVAASTFEYLDLTTQERLLESLSEADAAAILNDMAPDDRTALLEELPEELADRLLALLSPEQRAVAQNLLQYGEDSIGRLMTPDYVSVRKDWTVKWVLDHVRTHGRDSETLNVLYVTDDQNKLIEGVSQYNRLRGVGRGQFPSGRVQSWV